MEEMPHDILTDLAQIEITRLYGVIEGLKTDLDEAHGRASMLAEELLTANTRHARLLAYLTANTRHARLLPYLKETP